MDSSSVNDVSTIADMPQHQMETPRNHNHTFAASPNKSFVSPLKHHHHHQQQTPSVSKNSFRMDSSTMDMEDSMMDDQATVDDGKLQNMDSACLHSGSTIMMRAYSTQATIGVEQIGDAKFFTAKALGLGLGRDEEVLTIRKMNSSDAPAELRHGDTVLLHSTVAKNYALGSRKFVKSDGTESRMELGFFSAGTRKAEMWTILSARPGREVLVGRAAVAAAKDNASSKHSGGTHAPVRSGDPILLRNCQNGGILSISDKGALILLTDSYDHGQMSDDPSLLGRLQHHDRLYPTPNDTFQLLLSSTPPCPPWVAGRSVDERIFLTGSYLLQPRRNQRSAEFESNLFSGHDSHSSSLLEATQRYVPSDATLSSKTKEKILIDEVIGSFLGLEGLHIRLKGAKGHTSSLDHFEFQLFDADGVSFDASLRNLVEQILPLSTSYVRVRNFISSRHPGYEYGRVMQAFCEALDGLLQDYVHFVAQLERELRRYSTSNTLTMKSIYFQITPSLHSMSILEHATKAVCETKGGALINALWSLDKRSYMGDMVAKRVLGILLEKASIPYMDMMSGWLQNGTLRDPYEEFMVQRTMKNGPRTQFDGDSWMGLFFIKEDHVLDGVVSDDWTKQKILTTGKYWNAVNACHVDLKALHGPIHSPKIPKLPFNSDSSAIAAYIDTMYQSASLVLVRLMMENFKLMESLQIMKRYFLIDQGDFLMHFLDASEQELLKQTEDISIGRVQHCLSTSVQLTEAHREEYDHVSGLLKPSACPLLATGLRCRFSNETLVEHLDSLHGGITDHGPRTPSRHAYGMSNKGKSGIEVFAIEYPRVPFPISLVLSPQAMGHYKLLFRHLFFTKHVERRLVGVWRDHQLLKKLDSLRGLLGRTYLLRQRMLHFVQNLIYYMIFEVIENNWGEMQSSIDRSSESTRSPSQKQQTVDDILNVHNEFLERTLEACLLTNRGLVRSLSKLLNTCLLFTDQMKRFMDTTKIVSLQLMGPRIT
jgi:gamma-tubulin complex component 2